MSEPPEVDEAWILLMLELSGLPLPYAEAEDDED